MSDPFADGIDALFASPLAVDATYTPSGGHAIDIRVIRTQPTRDAGDGISRIAVDSNSFDIRRSDVQAPKRGDSIQIGGGSFTINGAPMLDDEGFTWMCPTEPA